MSSKTKDGTAPLRPNTGFSRRTRKRRPPVTKKSLKIAVFYRHVRFDWFFSTRVPKRFRRFNYEEGKSRYESPGGNNGGGNSFGEHGRLRERALANVRFAHADHGGGKCFSFRCFRRRTRRGDAARDFFAVVRPDRSGVVHECDARLLFRPRSRAMVFVTQLFEQQSKQLRIFQRKERRG